MGFCKCNEDDFERYVERLSSKGLNMRAEWTSPAPRTGRDEEKENTDEK